MADRFTPYVTPLSSDAVIRQTRRLMEHLAQTQAELERFLNDLVEGNGEQAHGGNSHGGGSGTLGQS